MSYYAGIKLDGSFYDFKIGNVSKEDKYPTITFFNKRNDDNIYLARADLYIKSKIEQNFSINKTIVKNFTNTRGCFKNNTNNFYFITYDTQNF